MADLGGVNEVINATKVHLDLGGNRHIMLQEITLNIDRPENREATDTGSLFFYGQSDDTFQATILLTTPEINTFHGYTILTADGDLPTNSFDIIVTSKDGTTKTYNIECQIPRMTITKPVEGGTKTTIQFRITGGSVSGGTSIQASDITTS